MKIPECCTQFLKACKDNKATTASTCVVGATVFFAGQEPLNAVKVAGVITLLYVGIMGICDCINKDVDADKAKENFTTRLKNSVIVVGVAVLARAAVASNQRATDINDCCCRFLAPAKGLCASAYAQLPVRCQLF